MENWIVASSNAPALVAIWFAAAAEANQQDRLAVDVDISRSSFANMLIPSVRSGFESLLIRGAVSRR